MLQGVAGAVLSVIFWLVLLATVYAFVHAAMQRPDAYTAADKLTKPVWLLILVLRRCCPGFWESPESRSRPSLRVCIW